MKLPILIFGGILAVLLYSGTGLARQSLPLTPQEITKLQRLFPGSSKNQVPDFQVVEPHEHVVWSQAPIDVVLPVGKERMIGFPVTIDFGYDKRILSEDKLKVQNNNGTLYLLAKTVFSSQRVQVKCTDTGQIILLNLSAQRNTSTTPLDIVIAKKMDETSLKNARSNEGDNNDDPLPSDSNEKITAVTLTRFAAQQLYAPKRLLVQPPNIYRTPMHTSKTVPLLLDGSVIAMPLASWRGGDLFVTAVLLQNQLKQELTMDPRNLNGHWKTASFFPTSVLVPAGKEADSTTVFLVSTRPFSESLQVSRGY